MRKFLSLFTAALLALSVNAAVINIDNTSADALRLALNNAASGDIIEMAAGTYVESNGDYIAFAGKDVTVRAAEGAEVILQPQVPVQITEGGCAHFQNIKIDASRLVELADWYEHLMYPADAANNSIVLEGCELYGFNINKSMLYCNTSNKLAAVTINNCYFHNIEKSVLFVENSTEAINVQVTNSTFANIIASVTDSYWAGIIDVRASGATLLVDHCTFYNVIPMNTDYSCVSKITLANGNASNCIFMLPTAQDGIRAMRGVTATNCITYNYLKDSGTGIHSSVTKVNCVQADPLFVDAANGNFALGEGSPALTMNDGQPIGDPRWVAAAPQPADPTVSVRGTMNEWGETPFELSADKTYATLTIDDIPAGDYQFKMFINGEWRSNGYTFHRGFTGAAGITGNDDNNMVFQADVRGAYTFTWTFANDSLGFVYPEAAPQPEETVVYNWSTGEDAVGTTILGGNSNISVSNVKIHTNTDQVDALKFGSSFVYADGKWVAIKPAEGTFKAGDVLSVAVVFNNSDDTKYCMVDLRAANGDTRIWMSDSLSTINGRTSAADPIVQTYTLAADADSLFIGRYGNTGMCLTLLKVVRPAGVTPQPVEHTYTVAGGSDAAFGAAWAPTAEANDMALVEGLYTWEKANITLAAGNIEFKVCEDHAWTNCWPSDNYVLNIPEAGIYTITITFNADSKEVAAIATKTGDAVVIPSIAMHGNFLGSWADTQNFEIAEGNATASLTLNIAAGNYEFGMRIGGSGNWTANGAAFTRENASAVIVAGSGNLTLAADVAGDYVFTWTYETNTLAITFPAAAPAEGPSAAPAEPTWPANQVKAVYSATYNADCGFGEWGSATQYSQDTYGKKYVTAGGGYFGLTFEGDAALNCSKMEALHLDIWIAEDASVGIVPIHGGAEVRVTKNLVGQQWNSFDIALTEFENGTDWTNTYQIKLDNISNKTFWVNNVYFYTTQAPAADTEAPTDVTASLASASYFSATITATATDNSDAVKFYVMDSEQELAVVNAVSGVAKEIVVKGLLPNTAYNFSVIAKDEAGNAAAPVAVAATTLAAPAPAEAPTYAADKVLGIQTDVYTNLAYGIQDWWSMPAATVGNLTATSKALCIEATSATPAGSCFGLAFAPTDITAYDALEMDVYAVAEGAAIKIQVIGDNANLPAATVYNLVAGQWNHVVLNIAGNTKNNCEQIGFYDCQLMAGPIFVQNVLFVQNDAPVVETNYYLVGTITDWAVVADDAHTFVANASVEGEYMLTTTLAEGDGIKVVGVRGETQTWYPDGMGNEYVVDAAHAGKVNIYFRPAGNADWAAFGGFIYIDVDHTSIDNTFVDANAVKVLRDGQLLIIKGEKTFNAQGQLVK